MSNHSVLKGLLGVGGEFARSTMTHAEELVAEFDIQKSLSSPFTLELNDGRDIQVVIDKHKTLRVTTGLNGEPRENYSIPIHSLAIGQIIDIIEHKRDKPTIPLSWFPLTRNLQMFYGSSLSVEVYLLLTHTHSSGHFWITVCKSDMKHYDPLKLEKLVKRHDPNSANKKLTAFKADYSQVLHQIVYMRATEVYYSREAALDAARAYIATRGERFLLNNRKI